jgi:hypothetical protein
MRGVSPARTNSPPRLARPLSLLMTPEHQDIEAMAITAEKARDVSELRITLDVLTSAERQDLANALLRAAWSAIPEETRIVLLDLLLEADDAMPADVG